MSNAGPTIQVPLGAASTGPSYRLLQRQCIVTVGETQIANMGDGQGLRVAFEVKNTLKPQEPNTCNLKIYNLAPDTRSAIEGTSQPGRGALGHISTKGTKSGGKTVAAKVVPAKIDAGYAGTLATIFLGYVRAPQSSKDGTLVVTELDAGDGDAALTDARVNASIPKGSTATVAVQESLDAMGIGAGNLNTADVQKALKGAGLFTKGALLKGNAADVITDLCASVGLEFSIQRGQALFLPLGKPSAGQGYLLSAATGSDGQATGLIGSPTVDAKGILSCVSLLIPGLKPGDPVVLDSEFVKGQFRIQAITYKGDTGVNEPWYAYIEGTRPGLPVQ